VVSSDLVSPESESVPVVRRENLLVPVYVPWEYLPDVHAVLADRMAAKAKSADEVTDVEGQGPWDEAMVGRLHSTVRLEGVIAVLDACAQSPGTDVAMLEVATSIGMAPKQLAAQMGSLSKDTKRLFGHITWPISVRYQDGGQAIYAMNRTVARWWLSARNQAEQPA
jgi:hypothetical protein